MALEDTDNVDNGLNDNGPGNNDENSNRMFRRAMIIGVAVIVFGLVLIGAIFVSRQGERAQIEAKNAAIEQTNTAVAVLAAITPVPTETNTPAPTNTLPPTAVPTQAPTATSQPTATPLPPESEATTAANTASSATNTAATTAASARPGATTAATSAANVKPGATLKPGATAGASTGVTSTNTTTSTVSGGNTLAQTGAGDSVGLIALAAGLVAVFFVARRLRTTQLKVPIYHMGQPGEMSVDPFLFKPMNDSLFLRSTDLTALKAALAEGACCSIVGLSNVGKSTLLRAAAEVAREADAALNVYVDCNLMLALTDQAFYQVTLRAALDAVKRLGKKVPADVVGRVEALYQKVIEAEKPIVAALSFNDGIALLCEQLQRRVALLFDEFDDPFGALEGRVFLNLRALHDKYECLVYITATGMPLADRRRDAEASEFCELFVGHQISLGLLTDEMARRAVKAWSKEDGALLDSEEIEFVLDQAGGHPGLLRAATRLVVHVAAGVPVGSRAQALSVAREQLESDSVIRSECAKLWGQLSPIEQEALLNFLADDSELPVGAVQADLVAKSLIIVGPAPKLFSKLFLVYVRRQRHTRQPVATGVHVDVDAGEVWVDGERVPTLTDLEYRLLLLMYGRLAKLCDKYQIVEAVWGQEYIDEVDDARIEKLISRLRSKIERDSANPKYLQTVRGRGYKLVAA